MTLFLLGAIFFTIMFLLLPTVHLIRLRTARVYAPTAQFSVAVIIPCKGNSDPDFENNLLNIIRQDYPGSIQFLFCVESEQDSAYPTLCRIAEQQKHVQVCVAGLSEKCAQKTYNILKGMQCVEEQHTDIEIFVIADADIQPHSTWLQELVAPFVESNVGATTGFFRRIPMTDKFDKGVYLAGVLNSIIILGITDNMLKPLWGGSLAVRKAIMDEHNLYERLATEIVDDIAITHALHQYKLQRHYVKSCTLKSYCDMGFKESFEWFVRQIQFLQIYFSPVHKFYYVLIWGYVIYLLLSPFIFIGGLLLQQSVAVIMALVFWVLLLLVSLLLFIVLPVNETSVSPHDKKYRLLPWIMMTPIAFVMGALAMLKTSAQVKDGVLSMRWRGIDYQVDLKTGKVIEVIR